MPSFSFRTGEDRDVRGTAERFPPFARVPLAVRGKSTSAAHGARRSSLCSPPRRQCRAARKGGLLRRRGTCSRWGRVGLGHGFFVAETTAGSWGYPLAYRANWAIRERAPFPVTQGEPPRPLRSAHRRYP